MKRNGWTLTRRKKQAEMIQNWKPWEYSTGPKTDEGKKAVSVNARKHGMRSAEMIQLDRLLRTFQPLEVTE